MATATQLKALRKKYHLGEFRGSSGSSRQSRKSLNTSKNKFQGGKKMPRRKRSRRGRFYSRRSRSSRSSGMKATTLVLASGLYGAVRAKIASAITPITSKIPAGQFADNLGMGIIAYLAYKKGSGIVKTAGMAGLAVEGAMAGAEAMSMTGTTGTSTGNIF